ncbi:DNA polymerase III subunit gamma/tau [Acidobacteriota bacterium]
MSYLIYARKYRPMTFEEMIGQMAVVQTLSNAIKNNRVSQAYIFSGMRGVGKTTAARILAKALNCQHGPTPTPCNKCENCLEVNEDRSIDVFEIDGASNTSVNDVRELREGIQYKPIKSRNRVIIIDEVHMLSKSAFNALLKTLEEPPPNTFFIFATTEYHQIPVTIVSRCQHFEFKKITHKDVIDHLIEIAQKEKITLSSVGLNLLAVAADGSLRDAQSLLDQAVAFSGENIKDEDLREILGLINRELLLECASLVLNDKPAEVFSLIEKVIASGYDLRFFFKELIYHFRNLLLAKTVEKPQDLIPTTEENLADIKSQADLASSEEILRYLLVLQKEEQGLKFSTHPRIYLETLLVKLCHFKKITPVKTMLQDLESLKNDLSSRSSQKEKSTAAENGEKIQLEEGEKKVPRKFVSPKINPGIPEKTSLNPLDTPPKKEKDADVALKDPTVQNFIKTFKAQIISVESLKKNTP